MFNIALTNDPHDTDGAPVSGNDDVISDEQAEQIRKQLTEHKIPPDRLLRFFGVESVPDLPANRFDEVLASIKTTVANRARQQEGR